MVTEIRIAIDFEGGGLTKMKQKGTVRGDGNVLDLDNNNLVAQMIKNPPAMWETWV